MYEVIELIRAYKKHQYDVPSHVGNYDIINDLLFISYLFCHIHPQRKHVIVDFCQCRIDGVWAETIHSTAPKDWMACSGLSNVFVRTAWLLRIQFPWSITVESDHHVRVFVLYVY